MPPARDDSETDAGKVLSPNELDIEESDNVTPLDDGRYIIGSDGQPSGADGASQLPSGSSDAAAPESNVPSPTDAVATSTGDASLPETTSAPAAGSSGGNQRASGFDEDQQSSDIDGRDVRRWLEEDLSDVGSRYGFHVAAKSKDRVSHQQLFSDDVGTVFDGLLMWYAQQVDRNTPVEDVLGILLMESNLRVRYSPRCLHGVLDAHDLSPDDSIADLFEAMQDANGLVFPPEESQLPDR